jgi:hypothetical protein
MFEPRKARLRAPALRLQIVAAVVLSAVALVAMWAAAHRHYSPGSHPHAHAGTSAPAAFALRLFVPVDNADRAPFLARG